MFESSEWPFGIFYGCLIFGSGQCRDVLPKLAIILNGIELEAIGLQFELYQWCPCGHRV